MKAIVPRLASYGRAEIRQLVTIVLLELTAIGFDALKPWPIKIIVDSVLTGRQLPQSATWLVSLPEAHKSIVLLAWLAAATVLILLGAWAARLSQVYLKSGAGIRMSYELGADVFSRLQRLSLRFHGRAPSGDLVKRVTIDSACVKEFYLNVLLPLTGSVASLVVMFVIMWKLDAALSLVALAVVPPLGLSIWRFAKPMEASAYAFSHAQGKALTVAEQTLTALPIVRAFGREKYEEERFGSALDESDRGYLDSIAAQLKFKSATTFITAAGTALVMLVGGFHVVNGMLTIGALLVFIAYLASLYAPLESLAYVSFSYASARAGARRVFDLLDQDDQIREAPGALPVHASMGGVAVRFENVTAGYESERPVLHHVTFDAGPGEVTAIVGQTGAGKSTLVSLIPRFLDPSSGKVFFDDRDVKSLKLTDLRSAVALVLQESFLLPLSVKENIAYGLHDVSDEKIYSAARAARADEFIQRLPEGYDTILAERGASLSGGERQRIAIARALIKNSPVLILDEPTSALDPATEVAILEALSEAARGRTTFIIAHRMTTIQRADRILLLENGRIAESGTHTELLRAGGAYAEYWQQQFGSVMLEPAVQLS